MSHANARLTPRGRLLLVSRIVQDHRPVAHVAKELGVSRKCAHLWLARFRAEGMAGLVDRSSRPRNSPTRTPAAVEEQVLAARARLRCGPAGISAATGVPARTVTRILIRHQVAPLACCDPLTGQVIRASRRTRVRYERPTPGDLVHLDVKKLGRIPDGGGWRAHGRPQRPPTGRRVGYDYLHAAVDDHTRLAYVEVLGDEKGTTCAGFLTRAVHHFTTLGMPVNEVMTDNAKNYTRSTAFAAALAAAGARHIRTRPYSPWQNGKAERFNRTMQTEWAYRQVFNTNTDRTAALAPWLDYYNHERNHSALGGHPPASRLSPT